jgi:hypothetical protein
MTIPMTVLIQSASETPIIIMTLSIVKREKGRGPVCFKMVANFFYMNENVHPRCFFTGVREAKKFTINLDGVT